MQDRKTMVDTLPLFSKCRFHAAQLITEQEKCVWERERQREREAEREEEEEGTKASCIPNEVRGGDDLYR